MAKERNRDESDEEAPSKSKPESDDSTRKRSSSKKSSRSRRHHYSDDSDSESGSESGSAPSKSDDSTRKRSSRKSIRSRSRRRHYSDDSDSDSGSESGSRRRKKRRERERREEKEMRREKRKRRRRGDDDDSDEDSSSDDKRKKRKHKKKKKKEKGKVGAVTNSWGKYGTIRETDMWNKRPEFTAWLLEVKKINLESLPNWEEKQMFKEFMEDHNTATFPSKKFYNLDAYYKHKMEKEMKKGLKKVPQTERTIFDDEEQRRLEQLQVRERQKEQEVEALKRSMQSGMAQAMKEQAQLREEMAYQYKIGNFEAAASIQRRLDPDLPM